MPPNHTFPDPPPSAYWRVDFHVHTSFSPDSLATPEKIIAAAQRKRIDRLVVTDHNTIQGGLRARELDPDRVIVGEEIETPVGEILAFFVQSEIPSGLPPEEVISRLREQNAFISISHPFDPTRKGGWDLNALVDILPQVDAIETFNARCFFPWYNWRAEKFALEHRLLGTHGSDAHAIFELGRGSLLLPPFHDAASLKVSLQQAVSPALTLSMPWVHFTSRWAVWRKRRGFKPS